MLRFERDEHIACLTLDRPQVGNALSSDVVESGIAAVQALSAQPKIHTLLILGAGRHLCTGLDLAQLESQTDGDLLLRLVRIETMLGMLWHAPYRTVAVAQGRTWGAGADLFVACDERLVHADASFRFPGAGFGIALGSARLAERVGAERAQRWVAANLEIPARDALDSGLASGVAPANPPEANKLADWLAQAALAPPVIDRETFIQIRRATCADRRDADLAVLTRSASRPGLRARIQHYRASLRAQKPSTRAST